MMIRSDLVHVRQNNEKPASILRCSLAVNSAAGANAITLRRAFCLGEPNANLLSTDTKE